MPDGPKDPVTPEAVDALRRANDDLLSQLAAKVAEMGKVADQLRVEQEAHTATRGQLQSARNDAAALKAVLSRTLAHVGNAWGELGGDQAAVDRRRAELKAQLDALK